MPELEVYPLRYRDRLTGKWVRARCVAELQAPERSPLIDALESLLRGSSCAGT